MLKTLRDVDHYLAGLPTKHRDYTGRLEYVKSVLAQLGNPQDVIPSMHIAGTSGKGSTAYYAASLLRHAGYGVGLTVSPHVNYVSERAQVNGAPLPDEVFCGYINQFIAKMTELDQELSYVEFLDIFAYWLFAELKLDYIVIEVGLGGRLDPTNVISRDDKVCMITDIGFDHVEFLGDTLGKIAAEKAGIIQDGATVAMYEQSEEVMKAVNKAVSTHDATLVLTPAEFVEDSLSLPLFQRRNWQLAKSAVEQRLSRDNKHPLTDQAVAQSLQTRIPGRFEEFESGGVTVILDAAHNPQKLTALTDSIRQKYPHNPIVYVVAFKHNKAAHVSENLAILQKTSDVIVATSFQVEDGWHDSIPAIDIAESATEVGFGRVEQVNNSKEAVNKAVEIAQELHAIVVVTGSFYLVDDIRLSLLAKPE